MSRISRFVVLVTALASLFGVMSATAGAVTWTNDGSTNFTATGGVGTLTSTGVTIACAGADANGDAPLTASTNTYLISGNINFTNCTAAGSPATVDCSYKVTAIIYVPPIITGSADFTCGVSFVTIKLCHIEGSAHAQYTNETGTLSLTASSSVRFTGPSCPVGSDDSGQLTALDFTIPSFSKPTITRAA